LRAVSEVEIGEAERVVWLEGFGLIRVFKILYREQEREQGRVVEPKQIEAA
jgi:hypothetical protein